MRIQTKFTVVECLFVGTRERHTLHRACRCLLEFSANLEQKMRKCWTKMLYLYKVGPTFDQGPRLSKGIDNICMPSTHRGMRLRFVQQKSGLRYCCKIISAWSAPVGAIRERLYKNGGLTKNSRFASCPGEDEELNIIERHTSLNRVQPCHRRRRPPMTHSGRHDSHQRDWTH